MSTAGAGGSANDATAETRPSYEQKYPAYYAERKYLADYADDCDKAVKTIEGKLEGMKSSLADAKAEAKRARHDADKGR